MRFLKGSMVAIMALAIVTTASAATIVYDGTAADGMWTSGPNNPGAPAGANWTIDAGPAGQVPAPDAGTPDANAIDYTYSGHDWTIDGFTISEDVQIKLDGGSLNIANSNVSLLPSSANTPANLSGLNFGQNGAATTAVFTNSTVNVNRSAGQSTGNGNALRVRNGSSLSLIGADVNVAHEDPGSGGIFVVENSGSSLSIDANSSVTATGGLEVTSAEANVEMHGGTVDAAWLRLNSGNNTPQNLMFDFSGGTITLNDPNPLRDNSGFEGAFDWIGGAGSGTITHTDPSVAGSTLARKTFQGYFSINGTRINPTTDPSVDGLAALNAELAMLAVDGTFFHILEAGGQQTLVLIPEPSSVCLLALLGVAFLPLACRSR